MKHLRSLAPLALSGVFFSFSYSPASSLVPSEGPLFPGPTAEWAAYRTDSGELSVDPVGDEACRKALPKNIRTLLFEYFRFYADNAKEKVKSTDIAVFAKVAGMLPYESGGNSASVTDMKGRGDRASTKLFREDIREIDARRRSEVDSIDDLLKLDTVSWNSQTNFGLVQISADRLVSPDTKDYASRLIESMKQLGTTDRAELVRRCGTAHVFQDSEEVLEKEFGEILGCKYGTKTKAEVQCFGRWAMLCPNYNLTLAVMIAEKRPKYFATRRHPALCAKMFKKVLATGRLDGGAPKTTSVESKPAKTK